MFINDIQIKLRIFEIHWNHLGTNKISRVTHEFEMYIYNYLGTYLIDLITACQPIYNINTISTLIIYFINSYINRQQILREQQ